MPITRDEKDKLEELAERLANAKVTKQQAENRELIAITQFFDYTELLLEKK